MTGRKILAIIVALTMSVLLCACSTEKTSETGRFIVVEEGAIQGTQLYQYIMYDPDTMVMYSYIDGYRAGGPTVIYNADGTLKLYTPTTETD